MRCLQTKALELRFEFDVHTWGPIPDRESGSSSNSEATAQSQVCYLAAPICSSCCSPEIAALQTCDITLTSPKIDRSNAPLSLRLVAGVMVIQALQKLFLSLVTVRTCAYFFRTFSLKRHNYFPRRGSSVAMLANESS